jgi:preprotein translocase subunit SecY
MDYIKRILKSRDLRRKILFVLFLLFLYRLIAHVPIPGPQPAAVKEFLATVFQSNQVLSFLDVFSGGSISRFSIAMMAVGPYITASFMIQLLTIIVPKFEALSKEGEQGHQKLNQYSRIIAVPIALVEGYGMIRLLQASSSQLGQKFLANLSLGQWAPMLISITAGTMLTMWIGELITEKERRR